MIRRSVKAVLEEPRRSEYYHVLVTRYYPMALRLRRMKFKDSPFEAWDRDLAPSRELLKAFKAGEIDEEGYRRRFLKEVPPDLIRRKVQVYKEQAEDREVVFVCIEADNEFCHTWILLEEAEG